MKLRVTSVLLAVGPFKPAVRIVFGGDPSGRALSRPRAAPALPAWKACRKICA